MITSDSGRTNESSSSTGTLPSGFFSYSQSGRSERSIVTVSYSTSFSARTMRARAQ